ncbi:MAG: hypothetical protein EU543_06085, partial [Promethearchaeota archaeon]
GICGQAPSDYPDFLRFLVQEGIDSISLNFDTFARGRINTWRTEIIEKQLKNDNKEQAYEFLAKCDDLIERIRVPRGRIRNLVRRKRKEVEDQLVDASNEYDRIFNDIQSISYNFVKDINNRSANFGEIYSKFNAQIKQFKEKIPQLKRVIRQFGIF